MRRAAAAAAAARAAIDGAAALGGGGASDTESEASRRRRAYDAPPTDRLLHRMLRRGQDTFADARSGFAFNMLTYKVGPPRDDDDDAKARAERKGRGAFLARSLGDEAEAVLLPPSRAVVDDADRRAARSPSPTPSGASGGARR